MRSVLVYTVAWVSILGGIFIIMSSEQGIQGTILISTGNVIWAIGVLISAVETKLHDFRER